tara:strand:+ start:927 stop:1424 length:498 start_codon:yes stop_codon:yes gene_type:complete
MSDNTTSPVTPVINKNDSVKLNLHYYDGKIEHDISMLANIERVSSICKIDCFNMLNIKLSDKDPRALSCLNCIIKDYNTFGRNKSIEVETIDPKDKNKKITKSITNNNYDPSNDLFACDLLYLCGELTDNEDFLDELVTQFIDMSSGLCNPGRCTRLYQILLPYI